VTQGEREAAHAGNIIPVQHAWLRYKGEIVDLTLQDAEHFSIAVSYTKDQLRRSMLRTRCYGPVSEAASYFTNPLNVPRELLKDDLRPKRDVLRRTMLEDDGLTEEQVEALFEQFDAAVRQCRKGAFDEG